VRLLLEDGTETYGCTECEFTAPRYGMVRMHTRAHNNGGPARARPKSTKPAKVAWDPAILAMTLGDLIEAAGRGDSIVDTIERLSADRDEWKARARDAERRLNGLRRALGDGS
jgi:hypothetical protein